MELKPQTVMVAIQSLEAQARILDSKLENDDVVDPVEAEQLLVCYEVAALDLQSCYKEISAKYGDMPSYDDLIAAVS
jgi:hypothetical protein